MSEDATKRAEKQIDRFRQYSFREIELETSTRRVAWVRDNRERFGVSASPTPRQAFELLFRDFMDIPLDELPVVQESDAQIVWRSLNSCSTLDACARLGLDTRAVCRATYEKSTQAFVSALDPQLRFLRSYEEIRPYYDYCLEWIVRVDFEAMMRIAIAEARVSRQSGNKGYGAVVAVGNEVIAAAHDTSVTECDPSLHAEVNAIRRAVEVLGDSNLSGAILFTTCEPCPMCSSLAVWSNLTTIVFGASIEETASLGKARIRGAAEEIVSRSPVIIEVIGGVLGDDCRELYR